MVDPTFIDPEKIDEEPVDPNFENELTALINKHGMEKYSDTPDFILSRYLTSCLFAYSALAKQRDDWFNGDDQYDGHEKDHSRGICT